jgi:hypothetical protein
MTDFFDVYTPDSSVVSENYNSEEEIGQFETFGEDLEYVLSVYKKTPKRVWTMIDDDDGEIMIVNGMLHVNRICFIITVEDGNGERFHI